MNLNTIAKLYCPFSDKKRDNHQIVVSLSERERIRTFDRLLRRQMLYPAELRTHYNFEKIMKTVGAAGFEPATSWSQTRRDDRTTLRPD